MQRFFLQWLSNTNWVQNRSMVVAAACYRAALHCREKRSLLMKGSEVLGHEAPCVWIHRVFNALGMRGCSPPPCSASHASSLLPCKSSSCSHRREHKGKPLSLREKKIRKVFSFQRYIPYFSQKDSTLLIWAFFLEQAPFNHFHQEGKNRVQPFLNITYGLFKKEMKIKKKIYRMALISIALYESLKEAINATPP